MPATLTLQPTGQLLTVPTSWADVTLAQFVALLAPVPDDERTAAELLLGLDVGALNQLAADDVVFLSNLLAFAGDPTPVTDLLPSLGLVDVGSLPWGCLVLVQQRLQQEPERPPLAHLAYVLAVYRAQLLHGNADRVAEVEAALLAAPCTEVYPDAQAFYSACQQSLSGTPRTRATSRNPPTRSWTRAVKHWLSDLARRSPWTPQPRGIC